MTISVTTTNNSYWKPLTSPVTLASLTGSTVEIVLTAFKRLRIIGMGGRLTGAADAGHSMTINFNGTDFNGLYSYMPALVLGSGVASGDFQTGMNNLLIGGIPNDTISDTYFNNFEAFIELDTTWYGRYYMKSFTQNRFNTASPFSLSGIHSGSVATTTPITSISIANTAGYTFDANSWFQIFASKDR